MAAMSPQASHLALALLGAAGLSERGPRERVEGGPVDVASVAVAQALGPADGEERKAGEGSEADGGEGGLREGVATVTSALRWLLVCLSSAHAAGCWRGAEFDGDERTLLEDLLKGKAPPKTDDLSAVKFGAPVGAAHEPSQPVMVAPELAVRAVCLLALAEDVPDEVVEVAAHPSSLQALVLGLEWSGLASPSRLALGVHVLVSRAVLRLLDWKQGFITERLAEAGYTDTWTRSVHRWLEHPSASGGILDGGGLTQLFQRAIDALAAIHGLFPGETDARAGCVGENDLAVSTAKAALAIGKHPAGFRVKMSHRFEVIANKIVFRSWSGSSRLSAPAHAVRADKPRAAPAGKRAHGTCSSCGVADALKLCSRCGVRQYCSRECQEGDWDSHKCGCLPRKKVAKMLEACVNAAQSAMLPQVEGVHDVAANMTIVSGRDNMAKLDKLVHKYAEHNASECATVMISLGSSSVLTLCMAASWDSSASHLHVCNLISFLACTPEGRIDLQEAGIARVLTERAEELDSGFGAGKEGDIEALLDRLRELLREESGELATP